MHDTIEAEQKQGRRSKTVHIPLKVAKSLLRAELFVSASNSLVLAPHIKTTVLLSMLHVSKHIRDSATPCAKQAI